MCKPGRLGTKTSSFIRAAAGKGHILNNLSHLTVITAGIKSEVGKELRFLKLHVCNYERGIRDVCKRN